MRGHRRHWFALTDLMQVVGIESYDHAVPLGRLLQDALALPGRDGEIEF